MKFKKVMCTVLSVIMAAGMLAGCGKAPTENKQENSTKTEETAKAETDDAAVESEKEPAGTEAVDLTEHVTLSFYLYGSPGVANDDILAEINKKLTEDINTSIEIKYIDWGDIGTKYPLLWASGETFDMAYASVNTAVPFPTLAKQGSLYDISGILDCVPVLKETIAEDKWASTSSGEGIYGVPTLGAGFDSYGFVYNKANCEKWGIEPVTDLNSMIAYCDAAVENGVYPFNGNAEIHMDFYKMFIETTGNWVAAPGISTSELHLITKDFNDCKKEIVHPAFTDEFEAFVKMMDEWSKKGYWPKDILSASTGDKEMYKNGQSVSYITHMGDWTGNYTAIHGQLPDQDVDCWYFAEDHNKVKRNSSAQDITVINANSAYPERCLMVVEKLMTDESYYRLFQYGIEGRQYEVVDGFIEKPEGFDEKVDGGGFAGWALTNTEFKLPLKTEHPSRYDKVEQWTKESIADPFEGFSFDPANVTSEIASISNVNSTLGIQLMLGKTENVETALQQYRDQLTQAGIDSVIEELNKQLADF